MRYVSIFLLSLQEVFEQRTRSLVWFLLSCINPLLMLLFWKGANISSSALSLISSYYLILMVGSSILMSHSEESIALIDIQEGRLDTYLLKPLRYFVLKWLAELPYRALQGSFAVITILFFILVFHLHLTTTTLSVNILLVICMWILAITLAQVYKMCLGFVCFWTTDVYGIFQLAEIFAFIFAGYILPLSFFPHTISMIGYFLPFAYIIYFPVASVAGFFTTQQMFLIIAGQLIWLGLFTVLYRILWSRGIKLFTGVGQ